MLLVEVHPVSKFRRFQALPPPPGVSSVILWCMADETVPQVYDNAKGPQEEKPVLHEEATDYLAQGQPSPDPLGATPHWYERDSLYFDVETDVPTVTADMPREIPKTLMRPPVGAANISHAGLWAAADTPGPPNTASQHLLAPAMEPMPYNSNGGTPKLPDYAHSPTWSTGPVFASTVWNEDEHATLINTPRFDAKSRGMPYSPISPSTSWNASPMYAPRNAEAYDDEPPMFARHLRGPSDGWDVESEKRAGSTASATVSVPPPKKPPAAPKPAKLSELFRYATPWELSLIHI